MPNLESIIKTYNKSILEKSTTLKNTTSISNKQCNYRNKNACLLDGKCLQNSLAYQATAVKTSHQKSSTSAAVRHHSKLDITIINVVSTSALITITPNYQNTYGN